MSPHYRDGSRERVAVESAGGISRALVLYSCLVYDIRVSHSFAVAQYLCQCH